MSALSDLTSKPFAAGGTGAPAPAAPANFVAPRAAPVAPVAAPKPAGGGLSSLTSKPFVAPTQAPAGPSAPSPYFQGKESTGTFIGISDQQDPFSGRPFLAYRSAGDNATTTDKTRTAPLINPEIAAPTQKSNFENPRMPQSASQAARAAAGATAKEQLDHRMALAVGGSNAPENLKLIPTAQNQAASSNEGKFAQAVADGTMSLFEAQKQEAQDKGLPAPFVDQAKKAAVLSNMVNVPENSFLGVLRNTILGLPKAAIDVADAAAQGLKGLADGITKQYTDPSPLERSIEADMGPGGSMSATPEPIKVITKGILRTVEPMVEPLVNDATAALIFNKPDLYAHFVNNIVQHGPNVFTDSVTQATGKTPVQVVGDAAQAVLGAYMPDIMGESLNAFASKGVVQALTTAATHGAAAGAAFGTAQAASSGSHDPKEIAAIVLKGTIAGAMLNLATAGVVHGVAKTVPAVVDIMKNNLPKSMAEAQRGFVKNPFVPGEEPKPASAVADTVAEGAAAAEGAEPAAKEDAAPKEKAPTAQEHIAATEPHTAAMQDTYKTNPDIQRHLDEIKTEMLDLSTAGFRSINEGTGEAFAESSTFPKWIPEDLRSADLFRKVFSGLKDASDIRFPSNPKAVRQRALYNEVLDTLDHRAGVDTSAERTAILKGYEDAAAAKETAQRPEADGGRSPERSPGVGGQGGEIKPSALADLALANKSPHDFFIALSPAEQQHVLNVMDPNGEGHSLESASHAFYAAARERIAPKDIGLAPDTSRRTTSKNGRKKPPTQATEAKSVSTLLKERQTNQPPTRSKTPSKETSYNESKLADKGSVSPSSIVEEHNGGVNPPENKGGMQPPEIDWTKGKDIAAIRQSSDTLERTLEKVFPTKEAGVLNQFLTEANRRNEAQRVNLMTALRRETKAEVVDKLGIKPATEKSAWVQRLGEGRVSLDELKAALPKDWENVAKASDFFRKKYDGLIDQWNAARSKAGLNPINKRPNYFRHFIDLSGFAHMYGLDFRESGLPTAISGMTEFFRSQSPWTNAAMRRLGHTTTDDAVGGFDNYLDTVARAIYHTDTVQRGRLVERYLRKSAEANLLEAQKIRDSGTDKETPPPIELPRLVSTLKQWTDTVSGKQNIFDRSLEAMVGRPVLALMRTITRQFGLNVIGGNLSAAVTHAIPLSFTLATVDKGAAFHGLYGTLSSPFLEDFRKIDGVQSDFLTRRFGKEEVQRTVGEKVGAGLSAPFHWVDQFISRFSVESKYHEAIAAGKTPKEAMQLADNYASRVIGDRSAGNLPPVMSTKTLGWLTQFQIEVNDNLRVLLHDIPKWESESEHYLPGKAGVATGIANRLVQFAVFSFMFNQAMQYIKGSGKGLDPIDMGLTLAGLNDEGHDKTLMDRLSLVGLDLSKELPFTSVLTGGQVPALQPLAQAVKDAQAGSPLKALEGVLASFASPVGGGAQFNKTIGGIEAWQQGYVTDAQGKITAVIPHTVPQLLQGAAFGKNAFPEVKQSNTELARLSAQIKTQQAQSKLRDQQAAAIWKDLSGMDAAAAKAKLLQVAQQDEDMAKRVIKIGANQAMGITKQDTMAKSLGVANGARAAYIANQLKGMGTDDEKKKYLADLAGKKILTEAVLAQVARLLKK